jgi:spermidine synthase
MRYAAGIFSIAVSTLLLEVTLSRIFSVLFFHHFAFLIVSTALFGFGFSGVYLFFRKPTPQKLNVYLSLLSLLFGLSTLIVYRVILYVPGGTETVIHQPQEILRLLVNYALLAIPFYFSGYVVGAILCSFPEVSGKLYAFDLIGAALGCLSVIWLVPAAGGSGAVVAAALISGIASLIFSSLHRILLPLSAIFVIACIFLLPRAESIFEFPIQRVIEQKYGGRHAREDKPEYSGWSPVSRIDVYPAAGANKIMLLDGGSNVSFMLPFDGNVSNLQPRYNLRVVPYVIQHRATACIIGPGGGEDVLNALSHRTASIHAVEMDPLIVDLVQGRYSKFIGGIFNYSAVKTINDEGRSYLRRSGRQFDLIQQIHNISPMAIASGALNLSESYLLTKEAFHEYWDHLKPDGMLAINRWGLVRAASTVSLVLQEKGIPDPENYVIVTSRQRSDTDTSLYLKKGKITDADLTRLVDSLDTLKIKIDYAPLPRWKKEQNVYYRLLARSSRDDFIRKSDLDLSAPIDDRPFFDHFQRFGSFQKSSSILPNELNRALEHVNIGDLALLTLLGEAALFSFIFILVPAFRFGKRSSISRWSVLAYFSALGLGFIMIEISLIQKHILFLGQPVYSIASVLTSILLSAGIGSYLFQRFFREGSERRWLMMLPMFLAFFLILELFLMPIVFREFLGSEKIFRFAISGLLIAPMGIVLGMPFPLGIRILGSRAPEVIPWGWALNAYATVVGSILSVILAITFGFRMNFLVALLVYALGFVFFQRSLKNFNSKAG